MAINEAWGKELREARHRWQERHGRKLPNEELAARIADLLGSDTPYSHVAVGAWYKGTVPKEGAVIAAIVRVLGADPERVRNALAPPLTPDNEMGARALLAAEKKDASKKASKKKRA